jgi:tRNA(Ile)-lysidine synthase
MHPRRGVVIRPLLDAARTDVLEFLRRRKLAFLHDATNVDPGIPRNRIRSELLPLLAEGYNPRIREVLAAEAELARADELSLGTLADAWCAAHLEAVDPHQWRLDADLLTAAPKAVAWRALLRAMTSAAGGRLIGIDHVRLGWGVATGDVGPFDAPGHRVNRDGRWIVLTSRPAGSVGRPTTNHAGGRASFECVLPIPGEVTLPDSTIAVSAELGLLQDVADPDDRSVAVVPKEKVAGGLAVRTRRPGDRLQPSDAGHRKLQDLLVDRKVPRAQRDRIPIVVDARGRIVWVAGHAVDRDFRVSDPAQAVVILRLKGVGGSF